MTVFAKALACWLVAGTAIAQGSSMPLHDVLLGLGNLDAHQLSTSFLIQHLERTYQ